MIIEDFPYIIMFNLCPNFSCRSIFLDLQYLLDLLSFYNMIINWMDESHSGNPIGKVLVHEMQPTPWAVVGSQQLASIILFGFSAILWGPKRSLEFFSVSFVMGSYQG